MPVTRSFRGVRLIRFGDFALDVRAAELHKNGSRVRLQEQPFRILVMLLERPGEVVLRDELRKRLWPNGTIVEVGHGINAAVLRLREALGDSADNPRFIETLARRGYRFIAPLEVEYKERGTPAPVSAPAVAQSTPAAGVSSLDTGNLAGETISHYQVLAKLGGGGMGVVYRAADLRLGRQVALKFLPQEMAGDPIALGRFQREARAASALNHPNICTIYGVEEHQGLPFIVMEYLEGDTLEAHLAQGPLPVAKALTLAIQMADALDAAHRKGIVHRDLKPGNVLLGRSGVKVLDFGLAKMEHPVIRGNEATHVTQEGVILGTPHYMSPEQVQGKDAAAGSDIFSFGLVLYEMLAGKRAFPGENSASVMAAVLTWQPPELPESLVPAGLDLILRRCLAKDRDDRWQSARDLKAALEWVAAGWNPGQPAAPVPPPAVAPAPAAPPEAVRASFWKSPLRIAIAAAVLLVPARLLFIWSPTPERTPSAAAEPSPVPTPPPPAQALMTRTAMMRPTFPGSSHFTLWAPDRTSITRLNLSPDGRSVAFLAGNRLFLRKLDSLETHPLENLDGVGTPFWSPDGRSVAAMAKGQLRLIRVDNGTSSVLAQVNTNLGGTWGPDGSILIGQIGDGIFRIPVNTGVSTRLTNLDLSRQETRHLMPQFLPGGRRFLFVAGTLKGSTLYAGSLDGAAPVAIMSISSNVQYVASKQPGPPGYLVYEREGALRARAFDPTRLQTLGEPVTVTGPIAISKAVGADVEIAEFSATSDALAYRSSGIPDGDAKAQMQLIDAVARKVTNTGAVGNIVVLRNWMADLRR